LLLLFLLIVVVAILLSGCCSPLLLSRSICIAILLPVLLIIHVELILVHLAKATSGRAVVRTIECSIAHSEGESEGGMGVSLPQKKTDKRHAFPKQNSVVC